MVRVLATTFALTLAAQALAFAPSTSGPGRMASELSATKYQEVKKTLGNLSKDNFSATLAEVEPFLLNDAGASIYSKSMRKISTAAKSFGVEVPTDFAKAAKATQKRREKQDAFIQTKEAGRVEAEAAAAEEAAAAAEAAAAPAEEASE